MGSSDIAISHSCIGGLRPWCVQDGGTLTCRREELDKLGCVQLLCLLPGKEGRAFSTCICWGGTKHRRSTPRDARSATGTSGRPKPKATGVLGQLQNYRPGWGLKLRGNFKIGTSPGNQAPGLELSMVSRGCQIGKHPKNTPRYPCQRGRLGRGQAWGRFRVDESGAEAPRVPWPGNLTRETWNSPW